MVEPSPSSECRLAARHHAYPQSRRPRSGGVICVDYLLKSRVRGPEGLSSRPLRPFESTERGAPLFVQRFSIETRTSRSIARPRR